MAGAFSRAFTAPVDDDRCNGSVTLRDKSKARCMHRREVNRRYCRQHDCVTCGGTGTVYLPQEQYYGVSPSGACPACQ